MSVLLATPPVSFFSGSTSSTSSVRATLALLLEDDAKLQVSAKLEPSSLPRASDH
jgi:hypothetical protein